MRQNGSWIILIILLISVFTVGTVTSSSLPEVRAPTIIDSTLGIGDTFDVNVTIVNVTNLYNWDVELNFNPAVLEANTVAMPTPNFLGPTSAWAIGFVQPLINNVDGTVKMGDTFMYPLPTEGVNGSGTLGIITFEVKAENAISLLTLDYTSLYTYEAGWDIYIPHEAVDGLFDNRATVQPPVASFYAEPTVTYVNETIIFNASASNDDAWLISYKWDFGDNTTEIYRSENLTAITTHAYNQTGTYNVTLTVTDYDNLTDTATTNVTVLAVVHDIAITNLTASPVIVNIGDSVSINVTATNQGTSSETFNLTVYANSTIIDTLTNLTLTSGDFTTITSIWNTTGFTKGNYTISAVADTVPDETDTADNTFINGKVKVKSPHRPVAAFTYYPVPLLVFQMVTFDASDSTPNGGTIISYEWDFGDGTTESDKIVTYAYSEARTYTVNLTITDSEGLKDTETKQIRVLQSPTATFTYSSWTSIVDETMTFNASESSDPDGDIINYRWDFGDETVINQTDPVATHVYTATGTYTVRLTVTDDNYLVDTAADTVIVGKHGSTITISVSQTTVAVNESTTISGSIIPTRQGVIVTIKYRSTGGEWDKLATVTTDNQGQYSYVWTLGTAGTYNVQARWEGDENILPDESDPQTITVQGPTPPQSPGIPLSIIAVAVVAIAIVTAGIAGYFLKARKAIRKHT